jgi:DNA-binding transcriptional regulator YiaG
MRTLEELEAFVEEEAKREGPAAMADLRAQRERFHLAREIAKLRNKRKLTQTQLSVRSGVPQSEISKIESGAANASAVTLLRLLQPMGRTLGLVRMKRRKHLTAKIAVAPVGRRRRGSVHRKRARA